MIPVFTEEGPRTRLAVIRPKTSTGRACCHASVCGDRLAPLTLFRTADSVRILYDSDGLQSHIEPAADGLSHAGRPGHARTATPRNMGKGEALRTDSGCAGQRRKVCPA